MRVWCVTAALIVSAACGGGADTPESLLEMSFAKQIACVVGVAHFERVESEMTFTHPNTNGDIVQWRVVLDLSLIHI